MKDPMMTPEARTLIDQEEASRREDEAARAKSRPPIEFTGRSGEYDYGPSLSKWDGSAADPYTLDDPDGVVDERDEIRIEFRYPLREAHVFTFTRPGGWTRKAFVDAVAGKYHEIYDEEDRTRTASPKPKGMLMNRSTTDGKYGIWGHDLTDLGLDGAYLDTEGVWHLVVGS